MCICVFTNRFVPLSILCPFGNVNCVFIHTCVFVCHCLVTKSLIPDHRKGVANSQIGGTAIKIVAEIVFTHYIVTLLTTTT